MKKIAKITGLTIAVLLIVIIAAAIIIPVAFKDKIKAKVESTANDMLNAKIAFADYKLSLIKAFPNVVFSLDGLSVSGVDRFEGDTLAAVKSFNVVFNLMSVFSDEGYEVKSIEVDRPMVNAIVLEDGNVNWDIMKDTGEEPEPETTEEESASSFTLQLKKFAINDARIYYSDNEADMSAAIEGLNFNLSGNMSMARTDLLVDMNIDALTFTMEKMKYLSEATVGFHASVDALLDSMKFVLKDNSFSINDILLEWSGSVSMPGDDISTDLVLSTPETSFKSLLSMVPAVYMEGFEELKATGSFALDGIVKGVYSSADSTLPDVNLKLTVSDGMISYPDLPEKISAININAAVDVDGVDLDKTTVDVSKFHFELAGNPFDMTLKMASPISDPAVTAGAKGKIDLSKLQQAIPLDSVTLNGVIDIAMSLAGRMSMIENEKYDQFKADGMMSITDMSLVMPDMPSVRIIDASFTFNPAYSELKRLDMKIGEKSDFLVSGRLENYIPYIFSDGVIKGKLAMSSSLIDLNEIMDKIPSDTATVEEDTTSLAVIQIPANVDFEFNAAIGKFVFDNLTATDLKGNIIVRDGVVTLRETGMKALGGTLLMNAVYDTRDTLKPVVKADMKITSVSIKETFNTFNTVQKLAPAANGLGGNVSVSMNYESLLGSGMMPLISTIAGAGEIKSETVQILESKTFDQMKGVLNLNSGYSNTVKDIKASFTIDNGRVYVKPFDTKLGNIKMNIAGDQGLDQTINYVVKTEIPRSDLGASANAMIAGLTAQASALGINYVPSEVIKVNLKVGGTFKKPLIVPQFAGGESGSAVSSVTTAVKEEAKEQVKEEIGDQAEKILKEAEVQAQVIRDKAAESAETIRNEADKKAEKLVKDAEAKGTLAVIAAKKAADALRKEADKKATLIETEANAKADKILAEAKEKADALSK